MNKKNTNGFNKSKTKTKTKASCSKPSFDIRSRSHLSLTIGLIFGSVVAFVVPTGSANAQLVISDNLTGQTSNYDWKAINGACLTAGTGVPATGIPGCVANNYYGSTASRTSGGDNGTLPDALGKGALRLTSNGNNQSGAIVSNFTFPSNQGVNITWTSVTYGGYGNKPGADGMTFFLTDGAIDTTSASRGDPTLASFTRNGVLPTPTSVGGVGGSLGYSCSNRNFPYDGLLGAYLGVGIDEFGNFGNAYDNSSSGTGFSPNRVALRGSGNTGWDWLNANYPAYYPSSLNAADRQSAVYSACGTGIYSDYSKPNRPVPIGTIPYNYNFISSRNLPLGTSISNQINMTTPTRQNAVPITYSLTISTAGLLNLDYSVNGGTSQNVTTNQPINAASGPTPSSFRFGFGAATGGYNNIHEITCFKAQPFDTSESSAATNVQQSAKVQTGSQVYLAYYHPKNWWGELTAQNLLYDNTTQLLTISPVASWNASCGLSGGICNATGGNTVAVQGPLNRSIITWNGSAGIPFEWANLSAAQKVVLTLGDTVPTSDRLNYLRGDRSNEAVSSTSFRPRTSVLGDIINSSPTFVAAPTAPYSNTWVDSTNPTASLPENTGSQNYAAFTTAQSSRTNMVYVGANDGLLHGFRTGGANNDGREMIAYMPSTVLSSIHSPSVNLDYSSTGYSHNFYVNATPGTGDVYYNGGWHTLLVGGTGAGGNTAGPVADRTSTATGTIFALDITNPSSFSEANASSLVLGEWNSNTLSCVNGACGQNLGATYGTPEIRRLHNGKWAALFGNGLNSATGSAGLFIMIIDPVTGAQTFRYLDTGVGPTSDPLTNPTTLPRGKNGIAYINPIDLDGDHITDYVYGGDVFGNVWRFDLTSSSEAAWNVSPTPVFSTGGLPITNKVAVGSVPGLNAAGQPGIVVGIGTGRQTPQTSSSGATFASNGQYLYGVWDWNLSGWNNLVGSNSPNQYASLTGPQTVTAANLLTQTTTTTAANSSTVSGYRTVSNGKTCWKGSATCAGGSTANTQYGWKLALPAAQEQTVYNPVIAYGVLLVNTIIPKQQQLLSCQASPETGYTMAVTLGNGSAAKASFFADANNNFSTINGAIVSGIGLGASGTPSIVTAAGSPYLIQQTQQGVGSATRINPSANSFGSRNSWIRLR